MAGVKPLATIITLGPSQLLHKVTINIDKVQVIGFDRKRHSAYGDKGRCGLSI